MSFLGTFFVLLGLYFLYVAICIYRIPDDNYESYKKGLSGFKDVFWGDSPTRGTDGIICGNSIDKEGKLKNKSSYSPNVTELLFKK